ncbi:cytochrome b5 domain-containing protein 1 [Chrysoperla carnea]|uniref:cytochrome b5 domain-containing protein 1 n=1 Tax=Chrysoperla carnea TaxID=189513 RepID=UPI001D094EA0|nr:cytochrome b5 domain-containing protein 1 [Chrysoperla carnea]
MDEILGTTASPESTTSSCTVYKDDGTNSEDFRLSVVDKAFRCKTNLCKCSSQQSNLGYLQSASTYNSGDFSNLEQNGLYFTSDEVVVHNKPEDIWVSYLGNVYDLTPLIKKHKGTREIKPLLAFPGKDISNWFNQNGELRHCIHPNTGVRVPYLPYGPIPDVRPHVPTTIWRPNCECSFEENDKQGNPLRPWWRSTRYLIGKLTKCARPIRIVNMLTLDECTLNVCSEDKLSRILERLLMFNSQASSYTFKYDSRVLDMDKTLDENHIFDERESFLANYLPEDIYIPAIHLYFNDDLQWDLDSSDECEDLEYNSISGHPH